MKNNTFFKLFVIILVGFLFRLWFLDKPEGLWNDEYVSWFIAKQDNWAVFWEKVYDNCHMPLYYFYLKLWMFIFPDTDLSLRWSSVLPSILSIPMMFLVGKELKDKSLGLLCALITALSSFLIYFAQEVRLYSLIFLLSSILVYYFIKTVKNPTNINYTLFFIANALIIVTHTIGILFSVPSIVFFLICTNLYDKIDKKIIIINKIIIYSTILISSSLLYTIAFSKNLSQFWSDFSLTKIVCTFIDYFSPVLTNLVSTPKSFISYIYSDNTISISFIIFAILPTIIAIIGIILGLKKDKILDYLFATASIYFICLVMASFMEKMVLITKYSIEIYPILILTFAYGLLSIKKEQIKKALIFAFVILNFFYLYSSPDSAPKRIRSEGHKAVADLLKDSKLKENDIVIFTYYNKEKFERYLTDMPNYNFYAITKFDFNYPLFDGENYFEVLETGKEKHKDFFTEFPNNKFQKYIEEQYISKIPKGGKIGIITLDSVSFIPTSTMQSIVENEKMYKNTSFIFLIFSSLKNNLLYATKKNLKIDSITKSGDWTLHVYKNE